MAGIAIKKGDLVQVITGKDKGVQGKVIKVLVDEDRVGLFVLSDPIVERARDPFEVGLRRRAQGDESRHVGFVEADVTE